MGDLDDDHAGVGVVVRAAAWASKSGALANVRMPPLATLNRSWSTLVASVPADGVGEGRCAIRVRGGVGACGGGASLGVLVPVAPGGEGGRGLVGVGDGHGHGDRVVVGALEPVGDLDDDHAGVGVVVRAAAWRLVVGRGGERQDAAVGDAEQVVVDAGGVGARWDDGEVGRRSVGVGRGVGADGLLVLGRVGGGRGAVGEDRPASLAR